MKIENGQVYQLIADREKLVKITDTVMNPTHTEQIVIFRPVFLDAFFSETLDQPLVSFEFYKEEKKKFLSIEDFRVQYEEYTVDPLTTIQVKAGTFKREKK